MAERAAYSRVYWSIIDDPKFEAIYDSNDHLATWLRLLLIADQAHPAPAHLPRSVRAPSITALSKVGLIDLLPGDRYRVHGLDAERARRREDAERIRSRNAPDAMRATQTLRAMRGAQIEAVDEDRRDETRVDEPPPREVPRNGVTKDEAAVFAFIASQGVSIAAESGFGRRLLALMDRRGPADVLEQAELLAERSPKMSDRQWALGLEHVMESLPTLKDQRIAETEQEDRQRAVRRQAAIDARRLEEFRYTGRWHDEWGPQPEPAA